MQIVTQRIDNHTVEGYRWMAYRDGKAEVVGVGESQDEAIHDLLDQEMPQTMEHSPEEKVAELAERIIETHHAKFDYFGFNVAVNFPPYSVSYDYAVRSGEWDALSDFHHQESNNYCRQGDMESAAMHFVLAAAMKERAQA
jgi:hypothetical protein